MRTLRRRDQQQDRPAGDQDLVAALGAMGSFQQVTQQADAKASTLVAIYVGLAALLAARVDAFEPARFDGLRRVLAWPVTALLVCTVLVTGFLLVQVLRPRAARVAQGNPFSLAQAAARSRDTTAPPLRGAHDQEALSGKAWEVANALAQVALLKNHYIGRSVVALSAMVGLALVWLSVFTS